MKNQNFDDYFYLKKSERRGVLLFFICSITSVILFKIISGTTLQITVQNDKNIPVSSDTPAKTLNVPKFKKSKDTKLDLNQSPPIVFEFNPNTLSQDSFRLLGFSAFCAKNIIKYRNKGGQFRNAQQLSKIFGLDTSRLNELRPYIHFGQEGERFDKKTKLDTPSRLKEEVTNLESSSSALIDVNRADSSTLVSVKGIGPYYTKKIISFRQKIGGIIRPEQLVECNIIPDSTWMKIAKNFIALPDESLKINMNKAGYKELVQHPYLEENLVKIILKYRENHGNFTNPEQLKNIKILTPEIYEKILPHFRF